MKKRKIKVQLTACQSIEDLPKDANIVYVGYYDTVFHDVNYLIDILLTRNNECYVDMYDITDGKYEHVDFKEFKSKNVQPSLFDFLDV